MVIVITIIEYAPVAYLLVFLCPLGCNFQTRVSIGDYEIW